MPDEKHPDLAALLQRLQAIEERQDRLETKLQDRKTERRESKPLEATSPLPRYRRSLKPMSKSRRRKIFQPCSRLTSRQRKLAARQANWFRLDDRPRNRKQRQPDAHLTVWNKQLDSNGQAGSGPLSWPSAPAWVSNSPTSKVG